MSLMSTLGKMALGIAVAKGVGKIAGGKGGASLSGLGALLGGHGGQSVGLGALLEGLGGGGAAGGGLGAMLNSALQGGQMTQQPDQNQEETAKIFIQAMVNAAKSDGGIDQTEQQKIVNNLGDEVSESERQFVVNEMQSPLDLSGFLRSVPKGAEQQVYLMSLLGIDLDTQAEAQYLDKLRDGLGNRALAMGRWLSVHQQR
jgi:uncharacterized membrane protein YebE (DUF533 family)